MRVSWITLLVSIAGCAAPGAVRSGQGPGPCPVETGALVQGAPADTGARLETTADAGVLRLSLAALDPAPSPPRAAVRITLENVSERILWVNGRFFTYKKDSPHTDIWLDRGDAAHTELPARCKADPSYLDASEYVLLSPGSTLSHVVSLSCFALPETGSVALVAHYKDRNPDPPPSPSGVKRFTGELISNRMELSVAPAK